MARFDFFVALDGFGLNGFEGLCGVARLRAEPEREQPRRLGAHGVTLPHAIKRSPSGKYLFYGAMDHDRKGHANQVGIFDLEARTARIVELPATVWHLGVHPERDVFYAPTQRC